MASRHYSKRRSNDEWMTLVTECRQSGLTDDAWCQQNGIAISSFYNAVHRLREQACAVPEHTSNNPVMNLTASAPDVVQSSIIPEKTLEPTVPMDLGQETSHCS